MRRQELWLLAALALTGCHDEGASGDAAKCRCDEGKVCSGAGICYEDAACAACLADEVCVSGTCYAASSACGQCSEHQVCVNATCLEATDPCAQCEGRVCNFGICYDASSPCAACGTDEKCVGGTCYDANDACYRCRGDQVCRKDACYEADDPCATCAEDEVCQDGSCQAPSDPCEACLTSDTCVDGECVACANTICQGRCCGAQQPCDLYTHQCGWLCDDGKPTCSGICCGVDEFCNEKGLCDVPCEFGSSCGPQRQCCGEEQVCLDESYCGPKCDAPRVLCGESGSEVCCEEGLVCVEGGCHTDCSATQTRCGSDLNLCCEDATDLCIFNKCLARGAACEDENDCELWEFCDTGSGTCVDQDENDASCIYRPPVGAFKPVEKWHYTVTDKMEGASSSRVAPGIVQTPIVINLTDDNGDGVVDENDIPDVVFIDNYYTLTALSGDDGRVLARTSATALTATNRILFNRRNEVGAADIDGDGEIEVIAPSMGKTLATSKLYGMVLRKEGDAYQWVEKYSIAPPTTANFQSGTDLTTWKVFFTDFHPTIANLDGEGKPEVITTVGVLKGDDWSKWLCTYKMYRINSLYMSFFSVADLDQDGIMEIINSDIYHGTPSSDGTTCEMILNHEDATQSMNADKTANSTVYNYVAVADLIPDENDPNWPGELTPEIVRVRDGKVSAWKVYKNDGVWSQRLMWETDQSTNVGGGNPVIADFDGDGQSDVGVAGECAYSVFNGQTGEMLWASQTKDYSSNKTGSSVFDFEGDGSAEVVYRDELKLRVYSGKPNGKTEKINVACRSSTAEYKEFPSTDILLEETNTSGTVIENPVIVDVDNDGRTEIVVVDEGKPSNGVTVYADAYNNWVRTRRIWNQHAYHVTNINEDGTVPEREEANWLNKRLNNYRANTQPADAFHAPNLQANAISFDKSGCPSIIRLTAEVKNEGALSARDIWVTFYIPDFDTGNGAKADLILGSVRTEGSLSPGMKTSVTLDWNLKGHTQDGTEYAPSANWRVMYRVDDAPEASSQDFHNECIESDNDSEVVVIDACPSVIN